MNIKSIRSNGSEDGSENGSECMNPSHIPTSLPYPSLQPSLQPSQYENKNYQIIYLSFLSKYRKKEVIKIVTHISIHHSFLDFIISKKNMRETMGGNYII